jgi:hypothetical protein
MTDAHSSRARTGPSRMADVPLTPPPAPESVYFADIPDLHPAERRTRAMLRDAQSPKNLSTAYRVPAAGERVKVLRCERANVWATLAE